MAVTRRYGTYEIVRPINDDRSVFEAVDTIDGSACVVKVPRRGTFHQMDMPMPLEERREILAEEAAMLLSVDDCPTVVRVLGWVPRHRPPYLVLERLGATLNAAIPDEGMEPLAALEVLRDVATALAAFHAIDRCHNDLKPENVLRDDEHHRWKLIDPAPMTIASHYYPNRRLLGPARDLVALARLFLTALFGVERESLDDEVLEYFERENHFEELRNRIQQALHGQGTAESLATAAERSLRNTH